MKPNLTKSDVESVLIEHPGKYFSTKTMMAELQLSGEEVMRKVSRVLYRLRTHPDVERVKNSASYSYRYILKSPPEQSHLKLKIAGLERQIEQLKEENKKLKLVKSPTQSIVKEEKAIQRSERELERYTYIEELEEPQYGTCGLCEMEYELFYRAETSRGTEFLCEGCGEKVNENISGYGGVF